MKDKTHGNCEAPLHLCIRAYMAIKVSVRVCTRHGTGAFQNRTAMEKCDAFLSFLLHVWEPRQSQQVESGIQAVIRKHSESS